MNDSDSDGTLDRAWDRFENGDLDGARRLAEKAKHNNPKDADPYILLAACARAAGDAATALALLCRAADLDPEWATPRLWTAEILSEYPERAEEALHHAAGAVDLAEEAGELLDALALKAGIEVDLGRKQAAATTLAALPTTDVGDVPPPIAIELAHLFLAVGDGAEARRRFERIVREQPDWSDAWHGLGFACEALRDEAGCRKAWLETLRLDRTERDEHRLTDETIEAETEAVLAALPPRARALLQNVPIIVADQPPRRDVEVGVDPRVLGMFVGTSHPDDSALLGASPYLTQILLFRRNLERVSPDEETLRHELRTTILHETGHFFGMSEEYLAAVGLD